MPKRPHKIFRRLIWCIRVITVRGTFEKTYMNGFEDSPLSSEETRIIVRDLEAYKRTGKLPVYVLRSHRATRVLEVRRALKEALVGIANVI